MTKLADFRKQYPDYDDMSDAELSDALYRKYYNDMPRAEFDAKIGYQSPAQREASTINDVAQSTAVGTGRGLNSLIGLPGEAVAGTIQGVGTMLGYPAMSTKEFADKFRWNNSVSRTLSQPDFVPETTAGRYAEALGRGVGASVAPEMALWAKGLQAARAAQPATSTLGQVVRTIGETIAENPRAAANASAASVAGASLAAHHAAENGFGPIGQTVAGIVGGVTPAGVSATFRAAHAPVQRARANQGEAGAYSSMVDDIGRTVDDFKDQVAVGATGQSVDINRRTLDILGEEMVRAGGDVYDAQQATIRRLVTQHNVAPDTAREQLRRLSSVHENSDLFLSEYPAVASSDAAQRTIRDRNIDLDALGRAEPTMTQNTIDYLANKGSVQSARDTKAALMRRQEDLGPSMHETLERIGPQIQVSQNVSRPATILDADNMIQAATRLAGQEYRAAYTSQQPFQAPLERLLNRWYRAFEGQQSAHANQVREATDLFRNVVQGINPITGQPGLLSRRAIGDRPNALQDFVRRRKQLNDMIDESMNEHGQPTALTRDLSRLKDHVDFIVGNRNPLWRTANDRWADMQMERTAQRLGDSFAEKASPRYRRDIAAFNRMAPEAQDIVRIHFLQKQYDKLDNLPDTHSVSKLFAKDHVRNMIRAMFGDQAVVDVTRAVRDQKVAEVTQGALTNSKTEVRRETKKQKDAETGLMAAVETANARGARNWIMERLTQILTERRNRPLSQIMTTPLNDTARVAMHLRRMQIQENRLIQLRQQQERARLRPHSGPLATLIKQEDDGRAKLLAEARAAIRAGAPRSAVIKRVREMGVDPMGL